MIDDDPMGFRDDLRREDRFLKTIESRRLAHLGDPQWEDEFDDYKEDGNDVNSSV